MRITVEVTQSELGEMTGITETELAMYMTNDLDKNEFDFDYAGFNVYVKLVDEVVL